MTASHPASTPAPLRYSLEPGGGCSVLASDGGPGGRRIVEAFGDLAMADHIAVIVPGNGHHLSNYYTERGPVGPRARGQRVLREMQRVDPGARAAVVVWIGYHTPQDLIRAASNAPAHAGAADLARLTHYLPSTAHITLIGHSYGATVCGLALSSARAEDVVALGSPGMGVWRRDELNDRTRLWAGHATSDWIRFFPRVRLGSLGLGRSPLHPELGAIRFDTGSATGHCGYYRENSESLRNIARIAVGRHDEVTRPGAGPVTRHPHRMMEVTAV
ncbi:hypothetical protein D9V41_09995 [Aeromicrobium phragmitis]|uniref:DUF1023 domain-containing protein n=1 Tax=Aeromicrobium phragmitis TaxID=2478914 RepID=A0A3L8PKD0_9ACTN|nr:hypothetical protein D9V41_09995 [Aeromicrobium phragmitis]